MKLKEAAELGFTRLTLVKDGKPVWNPYSFGDIAVFSDGTIGPWMNIYDPVGRSVAGEPVWKPLAVLTIPVKGMYSIEATDEFEPFSPPEDMDRFPGCPPKEKRRE